MSQEILFFISPWITQGDPLFFEGAAKKKLIPLMKALSSRDIKTRLVGPEIILERLGQNYAHSVHPISPRMLIDSFGTTREAHDEIYAYPLGDKSHRMADLLTKLELGQPDAAITWEAPAPFLQIAFPGIPVLHLMPGMVSRLPFPETMTVDPKGLFKQGLLYEMASKIRKKEIVEPQTVLLDKIRREILPPIKLISPFSRQIIDPAGKFERLALLPLQVSQHYAFRTDSGFCSQNELLSYVLEHTPPSVGLVVTQYVTDSLSDRPLNTNSAAALLRRYPNLIYREEFDKLDNCSQYLLPFIDVVVSASSSIGLQALLWGKPLAVVGDTHLRPFSDGNSIEEALNARRCHEEKDALLALALNRLQPLARTVLDDPEYILEYLERIRVYGPTLSSVPELCMMRSDYSEQFVTRSNFLRAGERIRDKGFSWLLRKENGPLASLTEQLKGDKIKVVSFDIFDTLVMRPTDRPRTVFELIEREILAKTNGKLCLFANARVKAEKQAREIASVEGRDEISLNEIYSILAKEYQLEDVEKDEAMTVEVNAELHLCCARPAGLELLRTTQSIGKRVILVSDMYLPETVVRKMLNIAGITEYDKLYLSSTIGLRKHNGALFSHVLATESVPAEAILHIGDNPIGDIDMAKAAGINTIRIPSSATLMSRNVSWSRIFGEKPHNRNLTEAVSAGLIQNYLFDRSDVPVPNTSLFSGSAFNLGYAGLGPIVASFALWIGEQARQDGIARLLFLARDGHIVKRVFDILYANYPEAPATRYVYASRRAARVAALETTNDILMLAQSQTDRATVARLLQDKLGLETSVIEAKVWIEEGLTGPDHVIKTDDERAAFQRIALRYAGIIIANAEIERKALSSHISDAIQSETALGIVDIGYAGTMQSAIQKILNITKVFGYYFLTFDAARKLTSKKSIMRGFAGNFVKKEYGGHPICKHGFLFETLFCNEDSTLLYLKKNADGRAVPVFAAADPTGHRVRLISEVHEGVVAYARDFARAYGNWYEHVAADAVTASRTLEHFILNPHPNDAKLLQGVLFENAFGGAGERFVIPPENLLKRKPEIISNSIWKQGTTSVLAELNASKNKNKIKRPVTGQVSANQNNSSAKASEIVTQGIRGGFGRIERLVVRQIATDRALDKYDRDREQFFQDSRKPILRFWGRASRIFSNG